MNSTGQPIRKRRAHKRSRNGCITCKQRHIRCDELKPVCTNCLTRGGDCGYPDGRDRRGGSRSGSASASASASASGPGSASASATGISDIRTAARAKQLRLLLFPTSPTDPFNALPVKMPLKSMELFRHFTNYRIFSRTAVPKTADSICLGMVLTGPGVFRAGLLMTALHYSWLSPGGSLANTDMEETYLYHKLEAMRHVNELVADPEMCTTDECIGLIAALAMAESGMGDIAAAEAHLKGLFTLVNMRRPEEWQHRFWGILQRIILVTGSFIAGSKKPEEGSLNQFLSAIGDGNHDHPSPQNPHHTRPTGPVFSTAPFIATRLSPFYMGSTPDLEACKADAEAQVLINALRRLSSLTGMDNSAFAAMGPYGRTTLSRLSSSKKPKSKSPKPTHDSPSSASSSNDPPPTSPCQIVRDVTAILLSDTDSYIISLLFKPHPIYPPEHKDPQVEGLGLDNPTLPPPPTITSPWGTTTTTPKITPHSNLKIDQSPYSSLPPELFPSSSRAWATAAYLYLHIVLEPLWIHSPESSGYIPDPMAPKSSTLPKSKPKPIDNPHLLRLLLDTLRSDITHTESAMRIGAYSKELWIWKVMVGAYALSSVEPEDVYIKSESVPSEGRICPEGENITRMMAVRLASQGQTFSSRSSAVGSQRQADTEEDDSSSNSSSSSSSEEEEQPEENKPRISEKTYIPDMKSWFDECIRSWSHATKVTSWQGAKENMGRIAWPEHLFDAEVVAAEIWKNAVGDGVVRGEV